jgi:predicted GIY-YIG superfamily endonuclease
MPGMTTHCTAEKRTALYRFYDAGGVLLYVGITNNVARRLRQHTKDKAWFAQVQYQSVAWYDSEWHARQAEKQAIRGETPRHNIAGAVEPPRAVTRIDRRKWAAIAAAVGVLSMALAPFTNFGYSLRLASEVATASAVLLMGGVVLVCYTKFPLLAYRAGCWLHRNFNDPVMEARR